MGPDERFWENIITGDKTWCFTYDPATKQQSADWVGQNSKTKETVILKIVSEDDDDVSPSPTPPTPPKGEFIESLSLKDRK
jgi:hypothetical protein